MMDMGGRQEILNASNASLENAVTRIDWYKKRFQTHMLQCNGVE